MKKLLLILITVLFPSNSHAGHDWYRTDCIQKFFPEIVKFLVRKFKFL